MKLAEIKRPWGYIVGLAKWLLYAAVIGGLCGLLGGAFLLSVEKATELREEYSWLILLLPIAGLIIAGLYRLLKLPLNIGTDKIIETVRSQEKVPLKMAPAIFLSTVLTHLTGGSAGREGAALQLGGSIGAAVGRLEKNTEQKDVRQICELSGMAALFSALFGTPLAATFFVLEFEDVGRFNTRAMMPCMVAAVLAKKVAEWIGAVEKPFTMVMDKAVNGWSYFQAAGIGIAAAITAIAFCCIMHFAAKLMQKYLKNEFVRIASGGLLVVALTLLVGKSTYNGGGNGVIMAALAGDAKWEMFLLKMLFTAITLSSGFKGGEIVPSFFTGATMGCVVAPLLGMDAGLGAGLGMIGVFCGISNAPLCAIMLSVELFGAEYLPLFGIAAAMSFMLSGHFSIYHSQIFLQKKLGYAQEAQP